MSAHLCLIAWKLPMGRPNWMRVFAYSTAESEQRWAPPTCSAARATAIRSSVLDRPGSAPPSVPISQAGVPSNSSRACLRVWSIVASGVRVSPSASPLTPKRLSPAPVRAATTTRSATAPSMTKLLWPDSAHPSPAGLAARVTPSKSQRPLSSVRASVPMVSPEASPGQQVLHRLLVARRHAWRWPPAPPWRSRGRRAGPPPSPRAPRSARRSRTPSRRTPRGWSGSAGPAARPSGPTRPARSPRWSP